MNGLQRAMLAAGVALLLITACNKPAPAPPPPAEVTAEAVGHFCGMLLVDHDGPKGQAFLAGRSQPLWFSSVRDTIAFLRLPGEARDVAAVYVNDMGKATHWDKPEPGAWVDARVAWFVVDSAVHGGMGAPEAVPFSDKAAAESFRDERGGKVVQLGEIADSYVLGPVDLAPPPGHQDHGAQDQEAGQPVPPGAAMKSHP